jgi:hypothetical protein
LKRRRFEHTHAPASRDGGMGLHADPIALKFPAFSAAYLVAGAAIG